MLLALESHMMWWQHLHCQCSSQYSCALCLSVMSVLTTIDSMCSVMMKRHLKRTYSDSRAMYVYVEEPSVCDLFWKLKFTRSQPLYSVMYSEYAQHLYASYIAHTAMLVGS